jgi:hypothetical protein
VHVANQPEQAVRPVGGRQLQLRSAGRVEQGRERRVERAGAQPGRLPVLQHPKAGIDARGERVRPQQPRAEAVDRRHVSALRGQPGLAVAQLGQPLAQALAQLAGGLLGERDGQHAAGVDAALDHRPRAALDDHGGLAAARVGVQQPRAAAGLHRPGLLIGQGAAVGRVAGIVEQGGLGGGGHGSHRQTPGY